MQAINRQFIKIINGTTQFVIPVFQRDYSWTESQCDQLWNDIRRVGADKAGQGHFMGSVVYVPSGDTAAGFTRWLLIDGQQRVTTLTLLIIALRQRLIETQWQPSDEDGPTPKRLEAYFLKNLQEDGPRRHKLVLRRHDQAMLHALLENGERPQNGQSRILDNYEFFRERVADADPATVYAGLGRLIVVDVTLDPREDNPQMIFESLNSTGLDLTQADLIRNFILMRVPEREQTQLYEKYWSKIDALFRDAGRTFDAFARDYMALHTRANRQARADDIYREFRVFFSKRQDEVGLESALDDMLRFARYHAAFSLGRDAPAGLALPFARIRSLAEVAAILVMRLYQCHQSSATLSEAEFVEALDLLESYVFRRSVCGMQTRGYWQVLANIAYRIKVSDPLTSLKVALHGQRDSYRFPRNDEFAREIQARDLYAMRNCHYLLDRLENHESKEPTKTETYTLEHIMPQNENLPEAWKEMLGDGWQDTQRTWLHRLGNLTLTGYNSTYQDHPFDKKKTIPGGFNESSIRLNKYVREQAIWTAREMQERGLVLAKQALAIWPPLEVNEEALRLGAQEALRELAGRRDIAKVPMSTTARGLFDTLGPLVRALGTDVIEMAEPNSVSYHAADFFLEVLPRKHQLVLLLNLDFSECENVDGQATDATDKKFFVNASHSGGVSYWLDHGGQLATAIRLIRQAYDLART